jgi:hypothetical protein
LITAAAQHAGHTNAPGWIILAILIALGGWWLIKWLRG